jgi:hypothetical protein
MVLQVKMALKEILVLVVQMAQLAHKVKMVLRVKPALKVNRAPQV